VVHFHPLRYAHFNPLWVVYYARFLQLWLDNNFSVDKEGLKPDIYLKENNWIDKAIKLIKE